MSFVDFVRFRVSPTRAQSLLATRSGAIEALRSRPGFRAAYLVELERGEWLDVMVWDGDEAATESFKTGTDLSAVAAYVDLMAEVIGEERGVLIDGHVLGG
jgi:hypothetical protein